jgi:hypothetical protein
MKHLKTYRLFETLTALTKEQKGFLSRFTKGSWSLNPQTGKVDVDGTFDCSDQGLMNLKGIEFGNVSVDFSCYGNLLTDLKGAPRTVGRSFNCNKNNLTSLEGAPETVGESFSCNWNSLTSLEGAPQKVGESFYCTNNRLTDLKGAPETVGGYFYCDSNKLTSLEGAPQKVGESFYCSNNRLTDLKGSPETVGGDFHCGSNGLTSLEGAPGTVGGAFVCSINRLTDLEGAPETVGGDFYCDEFATGNWTLEGKLEILKIGTEAAKTLISTIISPEALQKQIDENPTGMAVDLKGVWKTLKGIPGYEKLKFPPEYSEEAEMLSDLDDIGL